MRGGDLLRGGGGGGGQVPALRPGGGGRQGHDGSIGRPNRRSWLLFFGSEGVKPGGRVRVDTHKFGLAEI